MVPSLTGLSQVVLLSAKWWLGLDSFESSTRLDVQGGFFTHMSGTSMFFRVASVSRKFVTM